MGNFRALFWYHRHGKPVANARWERLTPSGWIDVTQAVKEYSMAKQIGTPQSGSFMPKHRGKGALLAKMPNLLSYLVDTTYDDGAPVGTVQLGIRTRGPLLIGQLRLADQGGLRIQVEANSFDEVLGLLEAALASPTAPWEPDPYPLDGAKKKRK